VSLGRIFPSYKKGTVAAPEEPIVSEHRVMSVPAAHPREAGRLLISELRYRLFAASRALLESVLRGSEQPRRGYAAPVPCSPTYGVIDNDRQNSAALYSALTIFAVVARARGWAARCCSTMLLDLLDRPSRCSGSWPHDSMVRSPAAPSPIPFS